MNGRKRFKIDCIAEIDSHIGEAFAVGVIYSPYDIEVEYIYNKYGGLLESEYIPDKLYQDIVDSVRPST